ncbi:MAG: 5-formyltetrahydrofolate cyclo-ligase [Rhodocyclaceae bacterium]
MVASSPDRRQLRERLIAAREALDPALRQRFDAAIAAHLERLLGTLLPSTLGFCWPFRGEPDLVQFLTDWRDANLARQIALPYVDAPAQPLSFRVWTAGASLVPDRYGIPSVPDGESVVPEVLLIPVNGFDMRGYRIGYGGGYFDRTLESMQPKPVTVGIGYELSRLPKIADLGHDQPLDWIVTEAGIVLRPSHLDP